MLESVGLGLAIILEGMVSLLLAGVLIAKAGRLLATLFLGVNYIGLAAIQISLGIFAAFGIEIPDWWPASLALFRFVVWTAMIWFAIMYSRWWVSRSRALALSVSGLPLVAIPIAMVFDSAALIGPGFVATPLLLRLADDHLMLTLVASLVILGWQWHAAKGEQKQRDLRYALAPFIVFGFNHTFLNLGDGQDHGVILIALTWIALAIILVIAIRTASRLGRPEGRIMGAWLLLMPPAAMLQLMGGELDLSAVFLHFMVDGVATVVLFYGVGRHHILGVELAVKWTIRRGIVAAAFILVFFAVSEGAERLVESAAGPVFGITASGLLAFAIAPLQRLADRLSDRAMPGVVGTEEYKLRRKDEMYSTALAGVLADGRIDQGEEELLADLRGQLGLTMKDHQRLLTAATS